MLKRLALIGALAMAFVVGGVNMADAAYTNYNFYYDQYHAEAPNNLTAEDLALAVTWGELTPEEYEQIVGEPYPG